MRKSFLVALLVALMAVSVAPTFAQVNTADLTALSAAFPADSTLVFAAVRTDDAFIDTLDAALAPVYAVADDIPDGFTIRDGLEMAVKDAVPMWSWDETFRPILGDTAAIGLFMPPSALADPMQYDIDEPMEDLEPVVALAIRDRAAAEDLLALAGVQPEQRGAFSVYLLPDDETPNPDDVNPIAISDSVLYFADSPELFDALNLTGGDFAPLSGHADMTDTLGMLSNADGYNAVLYFNQPSYSATLQSMAATLGDTLPADAQGFVDGVGNLGSLTVGAVILDGRAFALDFASQPFDLSGLGVTMPALTPLNPQAAQLIPEHSPLVIHATDFATAYPFVLDLVRSLAAMDDPDAPQELDSALAFGDIILRGATGLTLDEMFGWITSDYALTLGYDEAVLSATGRADLTASNPVDFAFLADASVNREAAVAVVDGLELFATGELVASINEAEDAEANISAARDGDVLTVTLTSTTGELPFPLVIQAGVVNDVFFIATPISAASLTDGLAGIDTQATYQSAMNWTLEGDTQAVYYVDFNRLAALVDLARTFDPDDSDLDDLARLMPLLDSATISQQMDANGATRSRAVITLK